MIIENEFLAVYEDETCKVFESKERAIISNPAYIAQNYIHSPYRMSSDPDRKNFSFKLTDIFDAPYLINCDGWRVLSLRYYNYNGSWNTVLKIADPHGEIKEIVIDALNSQLQSLVKVQSFVNKFRGFKDWIYYELKQENTSLLDQIKDLKAEVFELEKERKKTN